MARRSPECFWLGVTIGSRVMGWLTIKL